MEAAINEWNSDQEDDDKMIFFNEYEVVPDEHLWILSDGGRLED